MTKQFTQLHEIIVKLMQKFKVPGLAISISRNGSIVYEKGFGARDLEKNLPMTPNTLIGIGSVSKSFTALLILKLQQRGILNLDEPAMKYLEIEPFLSHPDIKIYHMLSHSTGIPSVDGQWAPIAISFGNYDRIYPLSSKEDYLYHISRTKEEIFFNPGEKFFYNNDMFTLLGFIIENLFEKNFKDVIREEVFEPLKMNRATVIREELERDPMQDYMKGYIHKTKKENSENKNYFETPPIPFSESLQAPGGVYASMHEMLNYGNFLLNSGSFGGMELLNKEIFDLFWVPRIDSPYGFGDNPKYCFGWVRDDKFHGETLIFHGGGLGVSTSYFGLLPNQKIVVSVAENDDSGICSIIAESAMELMLGKNPEDVHQELKLVLLSEELVGNYKSSLGLYDLSVSFRNFNLEIKVDSDDGTFQFPLIIKDLDNLEFFIFSTIPNKIQTVKFHRESSCGKIKFVTYDRYLYHRI